VLTRRWLPAQSLPDGRLANTHWDPGHRGLLYQARRLPDRCLVNLKQWGIYRPGLNTLATLVRSSWVAGGAVAVTVIDTVSWRVASTVWNDSVW
jgi:hypothetical protein